TTIQCRAEACLLAGQFSDERDMRRRQAKQQPPAFHRHDGERTALAERERGFNAEPKGSAPSASRKPNRATANEPGHRDERQQDETGRHQPAEPWTKAARVSEREDDHAASSSTAGAAICVTRIAVLSSTITISPVAMGTPCTTTWRSSPADCASRSTVLRSSE